MESTAAQVFRLLRDWAAYATPNDTPFNVDEITRRLGRPRPAVSAALGKAARVGLLKRTKPGHFVFGDTSAPLPKITRSAPNTKGLKAPKLRANSIERVNGVAKRASKVASTTELAVKLLDIAGAIEAIVDEIEALAPDITTVPTSDLLAELERRTK